MCDWTGRDTFSITRLGCLLLFIRADRRAMRTHTDTCCHPQCCCCFSPRRAASTGVPSSARPPSAAPPPRMNKRLRICRPPAAGPRPDWTWGRCTSSPRTCTTHTHITHTPVRWVTCTVKLWLEDRPGADAAPWRLTVKQDQPFVVVSQRQQLSRRGDGEGENFVTSCFLWAAITDDRGEKPQLVKHSCYISIFLDLLSFESHMSPFLLFNSDKCFYIFRSHNNKCFICDFKDQY